MPDTRTATQLILQQPELFTDYEIIKGRMDDVFLAVTGKTWEVPAMWKAMFLRNVKLYFKDKAMFLPR